MVTIDEILHRIAQDLRDYSSGADKIAAVEEFVTGCRFDMHISITTDLKETEANTIKLYGHGRIFYFSLANYEHGKALAAQLFYLTRGIQPDMSAYKGENFRPNDQLFLFLHLGNINPPPMSEKLYSLTYARQRQILLT